MVIHIGERLIQLFNMNYSGVLHLIFTTIFFDRFLRCPKEKIESYLHPISDNVSCEINLFEALIIDRNLTIISNIQQTLKETISHGIAYVHNGLNDTELRVIEQLYKACSIQVSIINSLLYYLKKFVYSNFYLMSCVYFQVVIVSRKMSWNFDFGAHLVVVMDTQYYDGRNHR